MSSPFALVKTNGPYFRLFAERGVHAWPFLIATTIADMEYPSWSKGLKRKGQYGSVCCEIDNVLAGIVSPTIGAEGKGPTWSAGLLPKVRLCRVRQAATDITATYALTRSA